MSEPMPPRILMVLAMVVAGTVSCRATLEECEGTRPDVECANALAALCAEQSSQEDCESQEPVAANGENTWRCNWARRVVLSDVATCQAEEAGFLCVAVVNQPEFNCADGCSGDVGSANTLQAGNSADEALLLRCPEDGSAVFGPIDDSSDFNACSPSATPTGRPEICACRAQVCGAAESL